LCREPIREPSAPRLGLHRPGRPADREPKKTIARPPPSPTIRSGAVELPSRLVKAARRVGVRYPPRSFKVCPARRFRADRDPGRGGEGHLVGKTLATGYNNTLGAVIGEAGMACVYERATPASAASASPSSFPPQYAAPAPEVASRFSAGRGGGRRIHTPYVVDSPTTSIDLGRAGRSSWASTTIGTAFANYLDDKGQDAGRPRGGGSVRQSGKGAATARTTRA